MGETTYRTESEIPVLPLRDMVVFPHGVHPLFVGTESSIRALDEAMSLDKVIFLVAKKDAEKQITKENDLYQFGTVARILQLLKLPDGTVKILVEGQSRARVEKYALSEDFIQASLSVVDDDEPQLSDEEGLIKLLLEQFEKYAKGGKKIPQEIVSSLSAIDSLSRLVDSIATQISVDLADKQQLLETIPKRERVDAVLSLLEAEMDLQKVDSRIRSRVKEQMERSQKDYYLNEQIKAIQKEMGDDSVSEIDELSQKIQSSKMPKEAESKATAELKKLKNMAPMSAEATVVRGYLDWLVGLPWGKKSRVRKDIHSAQQVLDEDHYGLEDVKERIIEYLAVQNRVKNTKGPILCLVGPPGVGKTSLGKSIARATNRKFVRMALGGVRDEAEIRGHRKTYIGSMPGKVIQKISKAEASNPLFLLDEIDKMGMDMRGDPASALLEVLDPEQNSSFNDHYLEVDFDLSDVFFVCTSNSMNIPPALLDRMEVIRLPGYTEEEKLNIARRYLLPKQFENNGLEAKQVKMSDGAILDLIRHYTREAGVRNLEREIAKVTRKLVTEIALREKVLSKGARRRKQDGAIRISSKSIEKYNGVQRFKYGLADAEDRVGVVTGLAWTQVGGELLNIEAVAVSGKGKQIRTGSLGDVMQESIQAALTVVRSRSESLGIDLNYFDEHDVHVHVPEGATPKDGPSAGIGMCTALVSAVTDIPVRSDVAMTGEINLRGQVLPIGGLKEKLLAAHRGGIKRVLISEENEKDLKEIPSNVVANLEIIPVKWIEEVFELALVTSPKSLMPSKKKDTSEKRGGSRRKEMPKTESASTH